MKKLQWQNKEGKSHYLAAIYVDDKKVFPCRDQTNTGEVKQATIVSGQSESKPVWEAPEDISQSQQELSDGLKQMRYVAYVFTKECHPDMPDSSNLFGTIVNANISHLIGMATIKALKEKL